MENTRKNKETFLTQYWGQDVAIKLYDDGSFRGDKTLNADSIQFCDFLLLKNLQDITDEDAIIIAKLSSQTNWDFKVSRRDDSMVHVEFTEDCDIWHHVGIDTKYGAIITNYHIKGDDGEEDSYGNTSIGKIEFSARKPVPYIAILDYLRSKGYLTPFNDLTIDKIKDYGWARFK